MVKIAKKLKKNNVAVDVVSFGAEDENQVRRYIHIHSWGGVLELPRLPNPAMPPKRSASAPEPSTSSSDASSDSSSSEGEQLPAQAQTTCLWGGVGCWSGSGFGGTCPFVARARHLAQCRLSAAYNARTSMSSPSCCTASTPRDPALLPHTGVPRALAKHHPPYPRAASTLRHTSPLSLCRPWPCRRSWRRSWRPSTPTATATWSSSRPGLCCPTCSSRRPSSRWALSAAEL
jgi:hypothetical protein